MDVRFPSGAVSPPSTRVGRAIVTPPTAKGTLVAVFRRLRLPERTLHLCADSGAGAGGSCTAYRGVHWCVPFVVKVEDEAGDLTEEWLGLRQLNAVRSAQG